MTPRAKSPFPFLATLALCAPALAQGPIDLKVAAKKGASVWLLQRTTHTQAIDAQGMELGCEHTLNRVLQFTVKDVDGKGHALVETRIARAYGEFSLPMGMGDASFDSAAPATAAPAADEEEQDGWSSSMQQLFLAGVGKPFTAKVDAKGRVVEWMDDAKALLTSVPSAGTTGRMLGAPTLSEAALAGLIAESFGELPEQPVAVGGAWQRRVALTQAVAPATQALELKLVKADAGSCEIAIAGTVEKSAPSLPAPDGDAGEFEGDEDGSQAAAEREIDRTLQIKNGKVTGNVRITRTDGFVTDAKSTTSMDVEMSAGPWGEVSMSLTTTKTLARTTAAAAAAEPTKPEPKKEAAKPAAPTTGGGKK